ncbi:hypothetical protein [Nesterenkonia pannonica]|uniref:hypothetical protein n=1 Tax=Nesterenkonia pannonica TaxID=1548602 RepID=UPI0021640E10|nr:hypothetical protein [Nesterenkonia pannonica]
MRAWIDRSQPGRGEYKDAIDIATAIVWFISSDEIETWLYEEDKDNALLMAADFDPALAATMHLSTQIQAHLSPSVAKELFRQWRQTDIDLLLRNIRSHELPNWPTAKAQQRNLLTAIGQGRL